MKYVLYYDLNKFYYSGDGINHHWTFDKNAATKHATKKEAEETAKFVVAFYNNQIVVKIKGIRSKMVQKEFRWD